MQTILPGYHKLQAYAIALSNAPWWVDIMILENSGNVILSVQSGDVCLIH